MKKIVLPALLMFSLGAFAQNNEKPADASATKLNTTRTKEVKSGEVRTKNVTAAPTVNMVDQPASGKQTQNVTTTEEKRVKPQNPSATKP